MLSTQSRRALFLAGRRSIRRGYTSATAASSSSSSGLKLTAVAGGILIGGALVSGSPASLAAKIPTGGDIINSGTPVKEASTGILFPQLCNGYYFVGAGVRVKYGFVKVYAVGTYVDFLSFSAIKKMAAAKIEEALLDPAYPRTIRIVMNRGLAIDKYTAAIVEALEPRMKGQDLEK